jgi:hypothetical protein
MKIINKKLSLQQFLRLSEAKIQVVLHPAEANLAWFQSLQLPSTQSESPLALTLLLLNPTCLSKHVLNCEQNCFHFSFFEPVHATSG